MVVDDHEGWRRHVSEQLKNDLRYTVIGTAADGHEAVSAAVGLKPDLIVLDVGLPTIDGIETARRLQASAPASRILFLSEHRDPHVVNAALDTGACGYLVKSSSGSELLPAIATVVEGQLFVSSVVFEEVVQRAPSKATGQSIRHHDLLCSKDDAVLVDAYARFVGDALANGDSAVVVGTPGHRTEIDERLHARGLDVERALTQGRYAPMDVDEALAAFMVDDWPDETRFLDLWTPVLAATGAAARGPYPRVACFGECAPHLWAQGNVAAAIRLEQLADRLAVRSGMDIMCGYPLEQPALEGSSDDAMDQLRALHSAVHCRCAGVDAGAMADASLD